MATPRKPVPKERFLLWMLASVFVTQATIFASAVYRCGQLSEESIESVCPDLGRRYDQTFSVMIATILALLGTTKSEHT
jgi:hypothetical protein